MPLTLAQLNAAPADACARLLAGSYAQPWVAAQAVSRRPFQTLPALKHALVEVVRGADRAQQDALLHAHPALAGAAATAAWSAPDEAQLRALERDYLERFGWPCVLAERGPGGAPLGPQDILATVARRLEHPAEVEFAECLRQVHRQAELWLNDAFAAPPTLGTALLGLAAQLARHSDAEFAARGQLTVTYLTEAHQACQRDLAHWMREAGFDHVHIDAVGNVVGVYDGATPDAPRLLTGSHFDTVRNAGRFDGRLGIFVPLIAVRELQRGGRRLPFGIELVAFAEEEGQRYKAGFLGSDTLLGNFDPAWLAQRDAQGITMAEAMRRAGLPATLEAIGAIRRDPRRYLGFVEVHIEQGPVLSELDLPLGIVTSINGSVRHVGEIVGMASHAGTTPMDRRRDAAAAVAELVLYVEARAAAEPDLVGTVGVLEVPSGSINVVPGRCRFSLDLRATTDDKRDRLVADVLAELHALCARRGVRVQLEETMRVAAAPSAPAWQQRWEAAVQALGLPVHRMPSGAGHDAMKLHAVMPQAMLFVRGLNSGISHNPLEDVTADDAELAVRAFMELVDGLAAAQG
jgi:N-carbamoyl-L-amino-acid hydrolase